MSDIKILNVETFEVPCISLSPRKILHLLFSPPPFSPSLPPLLSSFLYILSRPFSFSLSFFLSISPIFPSFILPSSLPLLTLSFSYPTSLCLHPPPSLSPFSLSFWRFPLTYYLWHKKVLTIRPWNHLIWNYKILAATKCDEEISESRNKTGEENKKTRGGGYNRECRL